MHSVRLVVAAVAGLLSVSVSIAAPTSTAYCVPGQACWPSAASFAQLNSSVNGHLIAVSPVAKPCYPISLLNASCLNVQQNYLDEFYRRDNPGAYQSLNWESIGDSNCWLQSLEPYTPEVGVCNQANVPVYAVAATSVSDIQNALAFAIKNNIRVVIKNTGHDYLGRSAGPNALMIWTRNMNTTQYVDNFTPDGCSAVGPALTMGAGTVFAEAYLSAHNNKKCITGGAFKTVGPAGGFGQMGGHGIQSNVYGLAVDNIAQWRVVTTNGTYLTANACQNQDLFWALRGGGGGNYGVVTEVTYLAHPETQVTVGTFNFNGSQATQQQFVTLLASIQPNLTALGFTGYTFVYSSYVSSTYALPKDNMSAQATAALAPLTNFLATNPGVVAPYTKIETRPDFYDFYNTYVSPLGDINTPVGFAERLASRLIPRSYFADNASISTLTNAMFAAFNTNYEVTQIIHDVPMQIYATTPGNTPDASGATSANPAWRTALWHVVYASGSAQDVPAAIFKTFAQMTSQAADKLRALTPGGGCYGNEADMLEQNWQQAFWGSNYQRLSQIKAKYDPNYVLKCWKCVGFENYSGDTMSFASYAQQ